MRSTLLLLATDPELVVAVAAAARDAGFTVAPGRSHELAIDSLTRVHADVVLIHIDHEGADSVAFDGLANYRGARVFLFAPHDPDPAEHARISLISARSSFPVLRYTGDPAALMADVREAMG